MAGAIAIAPQIFQIKVFFFSLPGEVFLVKKKKKSFYEKFAGRQQYYGIFITEHVIRIIE
jgi:hypothetical protein